MIIDKPFNSELNALIDEVNDLKSWKEAAQEKLEWQHIDNKLMRVAAETNKEVYEARICALEAENTKLSIVIEKLQSTINCTKAAL